MNRFIQYGLLSVAVVSLSACWGDSDGTDDNDEFNPGAEAKIANDDDANIIAAALLEALNPSINFASAQTENNSTTQVANKSTSEDQESETYNYICESGFGSGKSSYSDTTSETASDYSYQNSYKDSDSFNNCEFDERNDLDQSGTTTLHGTESYTEFYSRESTLNDVPKVTSMMKVARMESTNSGSGSVSLNQTTSFLGEVGKSESPLDFGVEEEFTTSWSFDESYESGSDEFARYHSPGDELIEGDSTERTTGFEKITNYNNDHSAESRANVVRNSEYNPVTEEWEETISGTFGLFFENLPIKTEPTSGTTKNVIAIGADCVSGSVKVSTNEPLTRDEGVRTGELKVIAGKDVVIIGFDESGKPTVSLNGAEATTIDAGAIQQEIEEVCFPEGYGVYLGFPQSDRSMGRDQ